MTKAKAGDTVRIHYTGRLSDGSVFDSSEGREPLEFVLGQGQVIAGFDAAVTGMAEGDHVTAEIGSDEAYGPVHEQARQAVPRGDIPDHIPLELGGQLQVQTAEGQTMAVTVVELSDDSVTLDANHPLAGKDLTFAIELVSIA